MSRHDGAIERFVVECNIERYRRLLRSEPSPGRREKIRVLLAVEEARLARHPDTGASLPARLMSALPTS
jgi:hypothetical protein